MTAMPVRLLVCGNVHRNDDGAATWAVARLLPLLEGMGRPPVEVLHCGQLDIEDVLDVGAGTPLLVVDTAVGVAAGEVVTLSLDDLRRRPHGVVPHSSHALPIDQVLGLAAVLADEPPSGYFVGIGGQDFGYGDTPSAEVRQALPAFAEAIAAAIERLALAPDAERA
jgi:hydrogenase maturation protease